jgi:hypothetical protein
MGVGCDPVNSACDSEKFVATGVVTGQCARQSGRVSRATKAQKFAAKALKRDLSEYVGEMRRAGWSWQAITRSIYEDTRGLVDLNRETLRVWARNGFQAEDK